MLTIAYHRDGKPYGDDELEAVIWKVYQESRDRPQTQIVLVTSTGLLLAACLVLVAEGKIPHTGITIHFDNQDYHPDDRGRLPVEIPALQIILGLMNRLIASRPMAPKQQN